MIEVPVERITHDGRQHRRGLVEGLAIGVVVVALASAYGLVGFPGLAAHPSPSASPLAVAIPTPGLAPTPSAVPLPKPDPPPAPSPTLGPLPAIAMEHLPGLVALSDLGTFSYGEIGDRLITLTLLPKGQSNPGAALAFDLFTGQRYVLKSSGQGAIWGGLSVGSVTVSFLVSRAGTPHAGTLGVVIENVTTGSLKAVWPKTGYDDFELRGLADGYAYGAMVRSNPEPWPSGAYDPRASRAVVIRLATGAIVDLTPADAGDPPNAKVEGVDGGRALVVAWGAIDQRSSPVMHLVDLASGVSSDILPLDGASLPGTISTVRLLGGLVIGEMTAGTSEDQQTARTFVYDARSGALAVVPVARIGDSLQCPYQLDASHLACAEYPPGRYSDQAVVIYDTASQSVSSVPSPGLVSPYLLEAANGCVVVGDFAGAPPLAYAAGSGLVYRLELEDGTSPPVGMALVGNLVVSPEAGAAWRLP